MLFFILLFFTSCEGSVNLNDMSIIQAMGIDYVGGKFILTLHEFSVNESKEKSESFENLIIKAEGKTIYEAIKNAEAKDGKMAFYSQCEVFVISKNAALNNMEGILAFFNSNFKIPLSASVLLSQNTAMEVLNARLFASLVPTLSTNRIENNMLAPEVKVIDLLRMLHNQNGSGYLPIVRTVKAEDERFDIEIKSAELFKNYKPVYTLNQNETMGLLWLCGKVKNALLYLNFDNKNLSVNISSKTNDISFDKKGNLSGNIKISAYGSVSEMVNLGSNNTDKQKIIELENKVANNIKNQINSFLNAIKITNCDALNFNQYLKHSGLYKFTAQNGNLPNCTFNIDANFYIRHSTGKIK